MSEFRRHLFSILSLIALAVVPLGRADAQVSVTAADPSSTVQGTVSLNVAVTGNGFNSSASVKFLVTGTTDPGGIVVKNVNVSSAKKLIATIDVADTAIVNKFDIEVALSNGRKGKGTTLFTVQPKQTGKPPPPPPPPPPVPPPGSCSGASGTFPAFAYAKDKQTITRRTRSYAGTDIYVANSTGSCTVLVASPSYLPGIISYRQLGDEARIVWTDNGSVVLLKFQVNSGNVVPTSPSIVYSDSNPQPSAIVNVELSPDGGTIYFTDEYSPSDKHWQNTLKAIDVASCTANCTPRILYTFPIDVSASWLSSNDTDDRLYMSIHDRVPDVRTISFLQKDSGVWSSLRHVVSNRDSAYSSITGFASTAVGRWDYQSNGVLRDVVVFAVERSSGVTLDVIDVSNCGATGTQSCYGAGESSVVRSGILGHTGSFTSKPAASDPAPNLLVSHGDWRDIPESVTEIDLDSMTEIPLVVGLGADSAD